MAGIPTFDDFVKDTPDVPSFDEFVAATAPKTDLGTGALHKPFLPPSPMDSVPRPPLTPADMAPPPSIEGVLGPFAPQPTASPFNLPVTQIRKPMQSQGPIGPMPDMTGPSDVLPPDQLATPKQAPIQTAPMSTTPQFSNPTIPGYGPAPGAPKPPVPPGLQPQSVPPESINQELTTGTGVTPEAFANSGVPQQQNQAFDSFMKRWALPEFKKKSNISAAEFNGKPYQPTPEEIAAVRNNPELMNGTGITEDQIAGLAKTVAKQQGAQQELYTAMGDAALGLTSPEAIATMLTAELGGIGVQSLANSPRVVSIISKLPGAAKIRQAVDIAARNAVPAAFSAQAGKQSVEAAQAGHPVDAAVNALIAVAGALGIHADVKAVGDIHPPSPEAPGVDPYAPTAPRGKRGAQATAEALQSQGQGLAAKSWEDVAQRVQTENQPVTFKAGDRNLTLTPIGKFKGRESFKLVDDTGKELTGGTMPAVQAWMGMNLPEILIPGGESGSGIEISPEGKITTGPTANVPATGNPAAPISKIFSDQDALRGKILDIADNNPSFGYTKIMREARSLYQETQDALEKLVEDGVITRAQNGRGSVVYHKTKPAAPEAQTEAPSPESPALTPTPSQGVADVDTILAGKDKGTFEAGGQQYTVERKVGGNGMTTYHVADSEGAPVLAAGMRQPTINKWIAKQQAVTNNPSDNETSTKPAEIGVTPEQPVVSPGQPSAQIKSPEPSDLTVPPSAETAPKNLAEVGITDNMYDMLWNWSKVKNGDTTAPEVKPPTFEEAQEEPRKFASTQVNLPESHIQAFHAAAAAIPDADLAKDGRETEPHITALYGLHENDPAPVQQALKDEGPITAKLGKTSIFETPDADVVKLDVESPDLHRVNGKLAKLEHTNTHPDYVPHVTLAYVKKGEGAKYAGKDIPGLTGETVTFNNLKFSGQDRSTAEIPLAGATTPSGSPDEPATKETNLTKELQAPPSAEAPTFKRGDRVAWTDRRGKSLSGTIKSVYSDGTASIDTDQIMHAGGVPIGRIETVPVHLLSPTKGQNGQPPAKKPVTPQLGPLVIKSLQTGKEETLDLPAPPSAEVKEPARPASGSPHLGSTLPPPPSAEQPAQQPADEQSILASVAARLQKEADEAEAFLKESGFYENLNVGLDPKFIAPLAKIGANFMAQGILRTARWVEAMVTKLGEKIRPHLDMIRDKAEELFENMLQEARGAARLKAPAPAPPKIEQLQAPPSAEPTPVDTGAPESKVKSEAPSNEQAEKLAQGSGANATGVRNPEALEGVSSEDVQGTGGEEPTVPVSNAGSGEHSGPAGNAAPRGSKPGRRAGNGVQGVVPPAGRKGSAQPDLRSSDTPTGLDRDFSLTPEQAAEINNGGARTKARNNLEAIRTIKQIIEEGNRPATLEEQQKISRYVGWGDGELAQGIFKNRREWAGITEELRSALTPEEFTAARDSTINAHYTRLDLTHAMWDVARHFGFRAGTSVIEPGMGIGNFFITMPEDLKTGTRRTGVEMDLLTGSMARALYPGSNIVNKPYQDTTLPDGYFDFAIGNVPFQGNINIHDPAYKRFPYVTSALHNYFFAKTLDKLRPGGVMLLITSRGTMDAAGSAPFRRYMSERAELLGAIRLPANTFKENAGTEVTVDVIALRKRIPGDPLPLKDEKWVESTPIDIGEGYTSDTNEYFQRHPEMMMGTMKPGTMYHRGYPELQGEFSIDKFLEMARTMPAGVIPSWDEEARSNNELVENYPDASFIKQGQYSFIKGSLVQREGAYFKPVPFTGKKLERAKGLIDLRGAAREVIRSQDLDAPEPEILAARKALNKTYDAFVKKYGPVNSRGNVLVFAEDPDWPLLSALEDWDKDSKTATKRAIFTERTIQKPKRIEKVDTGAEALAVTLNDYGRIDWDRMQELTSRTPEELQAELGGQLYQNPVTKRWETADEYLSGNVRKKLTDAEFAAKDEQQYASNVEALKAVQPKDIDVGEIDALPGSIWIPEKDYEQFMKDVLKAEAPRVNFIPQTGGFAISNKTGRYSDQGATITNRFGNAYFDGMDLFEKLMNGNSPVARDTYEDMDGNKKEIKNPKATLEAVEKQRAIADEFTKWIWSNPERSERLGRKYNDEQNNVRLRQFDGSHLTFPGLNRSWLRGGDPDKHQKDAVWRIIQNGNTLLAHAVGAGKTLEMIMAAMEMRRLGLARKPMGIVPNHLVSQWKNDFLRAYPGAQLLVPTKKDFEKKNRKKMMSRIATGNYDAVIVGHKGFELLPVKDETFKAFMEREIAELEAAIDVAKSAAGKDHFKDPTTKQLVRRKKQMEEKLKKRTARETKDDGLTFEELGVDYMFVDEAHAFKNLGYLTMMDRIAGLPNTDANRSVDMLLKSQYLTALHGGSRGLVFATGTPVSNSIAEIWTMMRYLMPKYLEEKGFDQFDAWAKTFGNKVTQMEVAPEGGRFISRTRFADFINAAELMNLFRVVADIRTKDQLNLPTPAIATGGPQDIVAPASDDLKEFVKGVGERADAIRSGKVKPDQDNMLAVSSDARKASLDMRLVDPLAKDDPNSKANKAVENILGIYKEFNEHKAAQLVFLDLSTPKAEKSKRAATAIANVAIANVDPTPDEDDDEDQFDDKEEEEEEEVETAEEQHVRFTVYSQIRDNLIKGGIPANEIAFIHDANSDGKKKELFANVEKGRVRVLLGSTEKMGAGMNVQERLIALHHLDAPWRPSDVEQREGRIDRQGNMLWDKHKIPVRIFRYLTEGSFDSFMWQTIVSKAKPITRFMNGDPAIRRVEELGAVVLSYEQAMAGSSGNPLVREKIILDQDVNRMEIMRGSWLTEQSSIARDLATLPASIKHHEQAIENLEKDIATRDADKTLTVSGKAYEGEEIRKSGAEALVAEMKALGTIDKPVPLNATYRGFKLEAITDSDRVDARVSPTGHTFIRERKPEGMLYSRIDDDITDKNSHGKVYQTKDLHAKSVPEKEAKALHEIWDKISEKGWRWFTLHVAALPQGRLVAHGVTHLFNPNYSSPAGTIASLDHSVRGFDEDLKNSKSELGRYEKGKIELESRAGMPFKDEQKLRDARKRQAELTQILGEQADDTQAVAASEDDSNNPLAPLLKDPTAAMSAKWFPSRKYHISEGGEQEVVKGYAVNDELAVRKYKNDRKQERWLVDHIPSGKLVKSGFPLDFHAVDYARKAAKALDWTWKEMPDGFREKGTNFASHWTPPTETPAESVARLAPKPATPERVADPGFVSDETGSAPADLFVPKAFMRWLAPKPAGPAATKSQRRKVRKAMRNADLPDTKLEEILKKDYGIAALDKLDRNQYTDLIAKLTEKLPSGVVRMEAHLRPWDKAVASPSVVLNRSRAGQVIWKAANREYWRQKSLDQLYIRNYHKATKGLTAEDREHIKLYRYVKQVLAADEGETGRAEALLHAAGEDPDAVDTIDTDFLTPEQKKANDLLTKLVFNPIWQQSVKEGLVPEDRYIDDYLTFYREDLGMSGKPGDRKDRAALIAAETGMRLDVADKILAMANAKRVTFGPFDFRRGKFTLPGTLSLDEVANIYIRGFARKSAHTAFLKTANKMRSKITNPNLRDYARIYINQYVGVPQKNVFDDWIVRKANSNALTKAIVGNRDISLEQLASTATAVQYLAKIGLNLFTPVQNLTQVANTLAKAGTYQTARGALSYVLARTAPHARRAWAKELVALRRSGVLDSMANKIERPQISGLPGKAAEALTFLFDQSEQFNRGTAFFAGYFGAKGKGASESAAIAAGRDLVRTTQFFSGRLDAPLNSRPPSGRIFYQFKVFSLKSMEMIFSNMNNMERLKFLLWSVAIGGPTAAGVTWFMDTYHPDSPYTEKVHDWQETANLGAFLGIPRMAQAVGIWQLPLADQFSTFGDKDSGKWWEQMAKWMAGPTINAIADTFRDTLLLSGAEEGDANEKAWKFTFDLLRNWVPGGVTLRRLAQAMTEADNTEDQLRIIFAAYNRDNPNLGKIQDISRKLGVEKLIPNVLPDSAVVK